uniref:Uncharacterized protein n=1 Tax=Rhizophora mucronata TaxID=61149 RepID=A0A2P2QXR0_RHIMU
MGKQDLPFFFQCLQKCLCKFANISTCFKQNHNGTQSTRKRHVYLKQQLK